MTVDEAERALIAARVRAEIAEREYRAALAEQEAAILALLEARRAAGVRS
mgnify:CR=1 FL=1